jgi:mono/diheme cytochrome c family protein
MMRAFLLLIASATLVALGPVDSQSILHAKRFSAGDLEVGGELGDAPPRSARFIRYEDLLRLPQESYTVTDDSNLPVGTQISGVSLDSLAHLLGRASTDSLIVAICDDQYRANYPHDYLAEHHPLLVLRINGRLHDQWPPLREGGNPGSYLISHPSFKPAFKVLSHEDEPQAPYGVVRIEFRTESVVFGAIQPPGNWPENSPVEQGYVITRQDCFRCHNMGSEGGTKAGRSWLQLATDVAQDAHHFRQTIRNPTSANPKATMPAHASYDKATLDALTAYFMTFAPVGRKK